MKRMEIITIQVASNFERQARQYLKEVCDIIKQQTLLDAAIYVNVSPHGDLAFVIYSHAERGNNQVTDLGVRVAGVMKQFGLVDHTCWLMMDC